MPMFLSLAIYSGIPWKEIIRLDKRLIKDSVSGDPSHGEVLGRDLAHKVREAGAGEILAEIFAEVGR